DACRGTCRDGQARATSCRRAVRVRTAREEVRQLFRLTSDASEPLELWAVAEVQVVADPRQVLHLRGQVAWRADLRDHERVGIDADQLVVALQPDRVVRRA